MHHHVNHNPLWLSLSGSLLPFSQLGVESVVSSFLFCSTKGCIGKRINNVGCPNACGLITPISLLNKSLCLFIFSPHCTMHTCSTFFQKLLKSFSLRAISKKAVSIIFPTLFLTENQPTIIFISTAY